MNRQLSPIHLDGWLENWGRWLGCDLSIGIQVSDIDYQSPQGPHWLGPLDRYVKPPAVYEHAAQLVEDCVHATGFEHPWKAALRAAFYLWPASRLAAEHIQTQRWDAKRAHSAGQSLPTYQAALQNGKSRLARDLYVWRHAMPIAA
jgi:hypothetical protein